MIGFRKTVFQKQAADVDRMSQVLVKTKRMRFHTGRNIGNFPANFPGDFFEFGHKPFLEFFDQRIHNCVNILPGPCFAKQIKPLPIVQIDKGLSSLIEKNQPFSAVEVSLFARAQSAPRRRRFSSFVSRSGIFRQSVSRLRKKSGSPKICRISARNGSILA